MVSPLAVFSARHATGPFIVGGHFSVSAPFAKRPLCARSGLSNYEHQTKKHMVDQKTPATKAKMRGVSIATP
jgi:hypothetical protein